MHSAAEDEPRLQLHGQPLITRILSLGLQGFVDHHAPHAIDVGIVIDRGNEAEGVEDEEEDRVERAGVVDCTRDELVVGRRGREVEVSRAARYREM